MRIVKLEIDHAFDGVDAISLVEFPAIELNFQVFSKQKTKFIAAKVDEEKRLVVGPAMVPDKMIYRNDASGEYYVYFDKATVRKAAYSFLKANKQHMATVEHEVSVPDVTVVESWLVEGRQDKSAHLGYDVPPGTWMVAMRVDNDEVWQLAKKGAVKGFSIEGWFAEALHKNQKVQPVNFLDKIRAAIQHKFATETLEDGQMVTNDTENPLAAGDPIYLVTEDGNLPLPDGEYTLQGGVSFVVSGGVIESMGEAQPQDMSDQIAQAVQSAIAPLVERITALEASNQALSEAKEEHEKAIEEVAQNMKAKKPAAEPLKKKVESKEEPKTPRTTNDRVRQIVEQYS